MAMSKVQRAQEEEKVLNQVRLINKLLRRLAEDSLDLAARLERLYPPEAPAGKKTR